MLITGPLGAAIAVGYFILACLAVCVVVLFFWLIYEERWRHVISMVVVAGVVGMAILGWTQGMRLP